MCLFLLQVLRMCVLCTCPAPSTVLELPAKALDANASVPQINPITRKIGKWPKTILRTRKYVIDRGG